MTKAVMIGVERSKRADARRNYDRLIAEARTAFVERGTDASLEEIARRAGVGIGTLYRHFPNRQALVLAVVRHRIDDLRRAARAGATASAPGEALVRWLVAYLDHVTEFRGLADSMADTIGGHPPVVTSEYDQMIAAVAVLLARAQRAGIIRADVGVRDLFVIMNAVAWAAEKCGSHNARATRTLDVVLAGLRPTG